MVRPTENMHSNGLSTNAAANKGVDILVRFPGGETTAANVATGRHCTNYRDEAEALKQAASMTQASDDDCR